MHILLAVPQVHVPPGKAHPCYGLKKARAAEAEVTFESYYVDLVGWPHVLLRGSAHQECGGRVALKETGWGQERGKERIVKGMRAVKVEVKITKESSPLIQCENKKYSDECPKQ